MCMLNELTNDELRDLILTLEKEQFALGRIGDVGVVDSRLVSTVSTLKKARQELGRRFNE